MAGPPSTDTELIRRRAGRSQSQRGTEEPPFIKWALITIALVFSLVFLLLPLVNVFAQAFAKGLQTYWTSLSEPDSWAAIRRTLVVAAVRVLAVARLIAEAAGLDHEHAVRGPAPVAPCEQVRAQRIRPHR